MTDEDTDQLVGWSRKEVFTCRKRRSDAKVWSHSRNDRSNRQSV